MSKQDNRQILKCWIMFLVLLVANTISPNLFSQGLFLVLSIYVYTICYEVYILRNSNPSKKHVALELIASLLLVLTLIALSIMNLSNTVGV